MMTCLLDPSSPAVVDDRCCSTRASAVALAFCNQYACGGCMPHLAMAAFAADYENAVSVIVIASL